MCSAMLLTKGQSRNLRPLNCSDLLDFHGHKHGPLVHLVTLFHMGGLDYIGDIVETNGIEAPPR
jgi:hypothetical protein